MDVNLDEVYIEGKTFEHKEAIKGIKLSDRPGIFQWDGSSKTWRAKVHDHEIDGLAEEVKEKCPGCDLHVVT